MSTESEIRELRSEIDELTREITNLVKSLEADDKIRDRVDSVAERERDKRHAEITAALETLLRKYDELHAKYADDLVGRIEGLGVALRDLPERLLAHIERKIYELRIERHEARQAGVLNEPAPLPMPPSRRDPTAKVMAMIEGRDKAAAEDDTSLTAAQQRKVWRMVKLVAQNGWVRLTGGVGIWEGLKHLLDWIRHLH